MNTLAPRFDFRTRCGASPAPCSESLDARLATNPVEPESDTNEEDRESSVPDRQEGLDKVDEASEESFPASDPPAFTPLHIGS